MEAWASHKSFKPTDGSPPKPPAPGRNGERDFRGERRSNQAHRSTTDPEALLACKSNATAAKLGYAGHLLMENRSALIVDMELTQATGYAERDAALEMLQRLPARQRRRTVAADKAYDARAFIADCRTLNVTPHVAQNTANRASAIDARTTPATPSASASANASRNRSDGSRPSPAAANSDTSADRRTEPGS